jgi:CHAT domain-containing protein
MNQRFFKILLAIAWVLIVAKPGITQSGNQSDITGPTTDAIVPVGASPSDSLPILPSFLPPSEDSNVQPTTESPLPTTDAPLPTTDAPLPTTDAPLPTTDAPLPTTDAPLPTTDGALPPPGEQLPPPGGQLPTPGGQLPTPGGQLPTPGGQLPTPGGQLPTPGGQLPTPGGSFPPPRDRNIPLEPFQSQGFHQPPPPPAGPPNQMNNRPGEKPGQERPGPEMPRGAQQVDRPAYETQLQQVDVDVAVQLIEEYQAVEFSDYLGLDLFGKAPSFDEISATLYDLWQVTGQKSAFIYVSSSESQLDLFTVVPSPDGRIEKTAQMLASNRQIPGVIVAQTQGPVQHIQLPDVKGQELRETIQQFRNEITDPRYLRSQKYLENAQKLYQWLIAPIEDQLQAEGIDIIVLSMDSGLRSLPIAALHDGQQFLIEKYGIALVPSFGLTDVSYADVRKTPILAMGASEFTDLNPLPAVPIELNNIIRNSWQGELFLNQEFTVDEFKTVNQSEQFGIIHLATHGEFKSGDLNQSYIQFYDRKMNMIELKTIANELGWSQVENPPIELLVLSACKTAVGSPEAELGFAGLAVQAGVKSALASLWYVSDAGTLGLMSEFYQELSENPIKSQALRAAQIAMIKGELRIENGQLRLSNGETLPLSEELAKGRNLNLSHPYFWSAFMMIGNWN